MRKVFALPLLPSDDILDAFQKIKDKNDANDGRLDTFLQYVEATWMRSELWPVEAWSVHGRSIRTNNDVEGWHARFNRRARKGNLPFYLLVELLFREARYIPIQCKLVREGKLRRHKKRSSTLTQGKLMKLWKEYAAKERSASSMCQTLCTCVNYSYVDEYTEHLTEACARVYAPA